MNLAIKALIDLGVRGDELWGRRRSGRGIVSPAIYFLDPCSAADTAGTGASCPWNDRLCPPIPMST
ncbi:hypothetical protein MUK42_12425 [Musa troglodytarum]|uniref:Uncharacterized protein n=1 Tax=Musa troglodytarum TaxID=320322 RepID=A0A9E7I520_9LILI|nr:hypothetical protein MUK42_12425 [Musa troglodytarum]